MALTLILDVVLAKAPEWTILAIALLCQAASILFITLMQNRPKPSSHDQDPLIGSALS